ncbi:MAG: hypothetical protein HDS68_01760 [Bacteroidales bacterium]|nr:hypothetical protein [Bacteroidales bacterium]
MKSTVIKSFLAGTACVATLLCSCSDDTTNEFNPYEQQESVLRDAVVAYIDHTVLPTYADMADAAVELADLCNAIMEKSLEGTLTTADVVSAGEVWKQSRKSWELSEAFLFGPAANHNIDPHIDSWPLDKAAMDDLLADIRAHKNWNLINNGGYGLIGFHSLEYMLFELTVDENESQPHSLNYTEEELLYMVAVAEDLRDQCVCLEACWAGTDGVSERKQQILADAELDYNENYGWEMKHSGEPGSHFRTYQEAAEEIIQGCIDIADEVGNTKIGRPHYAADDEDKNYIESPYSLNSIEDFADNIRSIRNSYCGSRTGDTSISTYVASVDADLDTRVRTIIDNTIRTIEAVPEPFTKTASGREAAEAMTAAGVTLADVLAEVYNLLGK